MGVSSVIISLRPRYREALRTYAAGRHMGEAEAAAELLATALEPHLSSSQMSQSQAERKLMSIASTMALAEAARADWNEHLTLEVFRKLEAEHLTLYRLAAGDGDHSALNRRLGRRIKESAGAEVKKERGRAVSKHAPAGSQNLIKLYSVLVRSGEQ